MEDKRNEALYQFYRNLDRSFFMDMHKNMAHVDSAVPIGYNQTISQPSLVLQMTELLEIEVDSHVLEIGTGSGYQTALLAAFAKSVVTVECIEPLFLRAKERLAAMDYINIIFVLGDGSYGDDSHGPYDRIMVTAAVSEIPESLIEQLKVGGIMVIPVGDVHCQELLKVVKQADGSVKIESIELVRFVPLVGEYSI